MATVRDITTEVIVASSSLDDGEIVQLPSGRVGCVTALSGVRAGDLATCQTQVVVELIWGSVADGNGGDAVDYDSTTRQAMTLGDGSFRMGVLGGPARFGWPCLVLLNATGVVVTGRAFSNGFSGGFS